MKAVEFSPPRLLPFQREMDIHDVIGGRRDDGCPRPIQGASDTIVIWYNWHDGRICCSVLCSSTVLCSNNLIVNPPNLSRGICPNFILHRSYSCYPAYFIMVRWMRMSSSVVGIL